MDGLKTGEGQQRHTGRFLTLHMPNRRNRRRHSENLVKLSIIEDVYHRQTMKILSQVGQWSFNTFILDTMTGGRSLPTLLFYLFQQYGLLEIFHLDVVKVWKCFGMIEEGYHSNNPYHNAVHATDVTQAMHCFLQEAKIRQHITPLEIMTSLLAAVAHDLDHPGVNQPFLIATSNHLAVLYKNSSVLENHHWRSAICCLLQSGMLNHLDRCHWDEITFQVRSLILATDITRQQEFLSRLKHYMESEVLDLEDPHYRHFILQIALKCADICNPCRPWAISTRWSYQVCEEFFRQGDAERQLKLPVSALCDRYNTTIAKIQTGFFRFVVAPLFYEWDHFLQTPLSSTLLKNLQQNQSKWENMVVEEDVRTAAEKAQLTEECKEAITESVAKSSSSSISSITPSSSRFTPLSRRRHSVPLSLPKPQRTALPSSNHTDQGTSLRIPTNWTSSLSTVTRQSPGARRLLIKQSSFPPPPPSTSWHARMHQRQPSSNSKEESVEISQSSSSRSENDDEADNKHGGGNGCCLNDQCGTSSSEYEASIKDGGEIGIGAFGEEEEEEEEMDEDDNSRRLIEKRTFPRPSFSTERKASSSKPLLRLKSDSDLLQLNNGKIIFKSVAINSEDEKENAKPFVRATNSWRGSYRKIKPQGVGIMMPRFLGRRGSAPVASLQEEGSTNTNCETEKREGPRRRESAPMVLLQDQLLRVQHSADRNISVARRGSLPTEILMNSNLTDVLLSGGSEICRGKTDVLNVALRRRSMPSDLALRSSLEILRKSGVLPLDNALEHLFPAPTRSRSINTMDGTLRGIDLTTANNNNNNLCYTSPRWFLSDGKGHHHQHLVRQAKSFDTTDAIPTSSEERLPDTLSSSNSSSTANNISGSGIWDSRKVPFPFRRRSSVPTEACLFSCSAEEQQPTTNLVVDLT